MGGDKITDGLTDAISLKNAVWHYMDPQTVAGYGPWVRKEDHEAAIAAARAEARIITDADIENVAAAWASMDGKTEQFRNCKADQAAEDIGGHYGGYMEDARELLCRSGLFSYTATFVIASAEVQP